MTPKDTPHTATQGASESSERLGRFGHHPDPAIDFCVEIEAIEAEIADLKAGLEPTMALQDRIDEAICFRVGGDAMAVAAKNALRAALAQRQPAPADPQATELSMSMFATREDYEAAQAPSQEAREYPPLPKPWDRPANPFGVTMDVFTSEQVYACIDADRKARQQEAQRLIDAVDKLGNSRAFLLGWQNSEHCKRNDMVEEAGKWIDGISELYRLEAEARAALAKGPSHE